MQSEQQEMVISKFKRYGQPITKKSLERTIAWLKDKSPSSIDTLLKKLSQLSLESTKHDDNLLHAIEILSMKNKNLSSYEELIEQTRRRSIYLISPYEFDQSTWFTERPQKELFEFDPEDKLTMAHANFKRILDVNKEILKENSKQNVLGVLYENYSSLTFEGKPRLMVQSDVIQKELSIPNGFLTNALLLPGCAYIAKGIQEGKDLCFTVREFVLPNSVPEDKNPLLKQKFRQMCHNISSGKDTPGFSPADFAKYDCVHTPLNQQFRPTLIYGNVTINQKTMKRLDVLVSAYPQGVAAIILLLSDEPQEAIDFSIWLKCKVYLVPHISSDGPRLLPKLPILKNRIPAAKVLTNPARLCIEGKDVILVNYPLIRNIYTNCLLSQEIVKIAPEDMTSKVSDLIFSQGTVAIAQNIYWKQNNYFLINSDTTVVINDSVAAMGYQKSKGKGGMATTGNFERQGDFLCLMSRAKNFIQFCEEPQS